MSAETAALATTPHPLGKPGGPGLFRDKSLSLPPYIQNLAHSFIEKRGMEKSKAIQMAIGVTKNWASGKGKVHPEVRAAATSAVAEWEAAKAKARATPNKGDVRLSQPGGREYTLEFSTELPTGSQVLDSSVLELAKNPAGQLAFRFKHGWILINPAIPSRGHHGGGLAKMHGHKSGTVSHGRFVNEGGKTKFVKTHSSPSMAAWTKGVAAKADGVSANKAAAEAVKAAQQAKLKNKAQAWYISGISDNPKNHDVKILREAASMAGKADHPALKAKALSSVADATGAPGDHHAAAQAYHDAAKAQTTKAMATVLRMQADKHTKAATPAPAPKAPDTFTPPEVPAAKTLYQKDAEYHASGKAAKVTKAKQAKTAAYNATTEANKLNTAAAHDKAAKMHWEAHKANAAAGLTTSADSALEAADHHAAKAAAKGGVPAPKEVSKKPFTYAETVRIDKTAQQLTSHPDHQFQALVKSHGDSSKATDRMGQLQAEAIRRADALRQQAKQDHAAALSKPGSPENVLSKELPNVSTNSSDTAWAMSQAAMKVKKMSNAELQQRLDWLSGSGLNPGFKTENEQAILSYIHAIQKEQASRTNTVKLSQPMTFLRTTLDGSTAVELSQPMAFLRGILDNGSTAVELANAPVGGTSAPAKKAPAPAAKQSSGQQQTKHTLPPGAVGWKHGWVPVNAAGQPVGPSQKDMSAQQIKDSNGHDSATQKAIASAYKNKATADAAKAKTKAAAAAKTAASKAASAKTKAANKAAAAKTAAAKKAATAKAAATKAKQAQVSAATKQALADQKAKRPLTPSQQALVNAYNAQQAATLNTLRNNVHLSNAVNLAESAEFSGDAGYITVPTVSSQDGARVTTNSLLSKAPKQKLRAAIRKRRKKGAGSKK